MVKLYLRGIPLITLSSNTIRAIFIVSNDQELQSEPIYEGIK